MTKKYKVIAEGDFDTLSQVIPALAFISHNRHNQIRATIEIEEIEITNEEE